MHIASEINRTSRIIMKNGDAEIVKFLHVCSVDVFPGSKKATVEYFDGKGETVYERLGTV